MANLATAYVQVVPSTKGLSSGISKALSGGEASSAGASFGSKLASGIKLAVAAAAIGKAVSASISEGAALQQSLGGIETLFKDNASAVIANAQNAYKTAGLSANQYMETVTSFSASLLQSLGGDTNAAAKTADMALVDMADNANKFGTDMTSIQNAYQGFAKQNYTMLDNLKLGYGGTKTEMERLLKDAQEISGVEYDISSLDDVYNAIHVIQGELGVTGTTAKEAASTFSGSFSALKASFSNFLGALSLGEDLAPSIAALGETFSTFLSDNLLPMITNVLTGIAEAAPSIISALVSSLVSNLPQLVGAATQIIVALIQGLITALPLLIEQLPIIWQTIVTTLQENWPAIREAGTQLITFLWEGISEFASYLWTQISEFATANIINPVKDKVSEMVSVGANFIEGFWQGISDKIGWLYGLLQGWVSDVLAYLKALFKINSPSRETTWMGEMLALGLAKGITDNADVVQGAWNNLGGAITAPTVSASYNASNGGGTRMGGMTIIQNISATPQTPADLAAATSAYFEQARWALI